MRRLAPILILFVVVGCGRDEAVGPDGRVGTPDGGVDSGPSVFTTLARFDVSTGQLPEGVASQDGVPLVGLAPLGQILRVPPSGSPQLFGSVPQPTTDTFTLGLAVDASGDVFVGVGASGAAPSPAPGVYRIAATGGPGRLFASAPGLVFPNGIDIDRGLLYVTDSASGRIFEIDSSGTATIWAQAPLLAGDMAACGGTGAPFVIGANGIVHDAENRYVAVTDFGRIVRVPITANGMAGTPVVLAESCTDLQGIDGIALDLDGSILGVRNGPSNTMVRVQPDGTVSALQVGAPLDGPASVVIDAPGGARRVLVTNSAFFSGNTGRPSLVSMGL